MKLYISEHFTGKHTLRKVIVKYRLQQTTGNRGPRPFARLRVTQALKIGVKRLSCSLSYCYIRGHGPAPPRLGRHTLLLLNKRVLPCQKRSIPFITRKT